MQWMEVAGRNFERHKTLLYELELTDNRGNIYPISMLGIEKIASNTGSTAVGGAYEAFPHIPTQALDRLCRELGMRIGKLRVMNTRFGSVFVPSGSHKEIPQAGVQYTQEANQLCSARFSRNGSWVGPAILSDPYQASWMLRSWDLLSPDVVNAVRSVRSVSSDPGCEHE